jgi:hypothetical protein
VAKTRDSTGKSKAAGDVKKSMASFMLVTNTR